MNRNADRALCPADRIAQLEDELAEARREIAALKCEPHDIVDEFELLRRGGKWLGAARSWLKWNKRNGDQVTWGSRDIIEPSFTAEEVEQLSARVAATALKEHADSVSRLEYLRKSKWDADVALDVERAAHERTKAELIDARASLAKVRHDRDEMIRVHDEVEAAMREMLEECIAAIDLVPTNPKKFAAKAGIKVAMLVRLRVINSRLQAAIALRDYRDPPSTPRADRIAQLEAERAAHERTKAELAKVKKERDDNLLLGGDVNCDEVNRHGCGICHSCLRAERAAHERTKADLADLRAQLTKVRYDRDEMIRVHDEVEAARDVAQAELAKMRTIIEQQLWRAENPVESFEQQAETFYHDTGIVAPGKSTPLEWGDRWTDEARRTAWNEWLKKRDAEQFALWRSALGGNAGRALAERVPLWRELAQHAERLRMSKYTDPDAMMRVQETLLRLAALNKKGNDE